jgi:hypothetical protein
MIIPVLQEVIELGLGAFGLLIFALLAVVGEIGFRIGRRVSRASASAGYGDCRCLNANDRNAWTCGIHVGTDDRVCAGSVRGMAPCDPR